MSPTFTLETMHRAASYEQLHDGFRWSVPPRYNIAWDCCGRHARTRERFALYFEDESGATGAFSYWDLQTRANRLVQRPARPWVWPRGDRVAILLPQRPETAIAYLAIFQMGAIAVPLSHLFGPDALAISPARCGREGRDRGPRHPAQAVGARAELRRPPARHRRGGRARDRRACLGRPARSMPVRASSRLDTAADDPALIIYTSGTTGRPKGALIPHRALLGNLPGFVCSHDFFPQPGDMFWSPADWAWTGGLFDALLPTLHFGLPILAYRGRFDPERAFHLLEKYGVRNAFLFPTALKMMLKEVPMPRGRFDLVLRSLMSGGEAVGEAVMEWARSELHVTINEIFGQTEMNYVIGGCSALFAPRPGAMGRPYPGHRITLLDEAGEEIAPGEIGEIAVRREGDPVVFLEYWNNPQATQAKFEHGWGRTGDLALRDEDGFYWYQGRTDDVIKSAGYRVGPAEIEDCLLKHPAVVNAAVIGVPDEERGARIKACIVLRADLAASDALAAQIQAHVRERLAPYQCPREIEFIDQLPMTTTGKIQRRVLRERG